MTLAIIDGDVLCYEACYGIWEDRLREIGRITDNHSIMVLDAEGNKAPIEFPKEVERKYLEKGWKRFKYLLKSLLETVYCDEYIMAVGGEGNFRNLLYPGYKMNRHVDPTKRNIFVPTLRKLAVAEDLAIAADGREADDLIRIWALEAEAAGDDYIICTIDKDLRCIPGKHYHLQHKKMTLVDSTAASRHYYTQLLMGDTTDNIPGIPGTGKKTAENLLQSCTNDNEFQETVIGAYIACYGDDWYSFFLSNAKMIHIQRNLDDYFNAKEWPIIKELTE